VPIRVARTGVELTVLLVGWLLGGTVGIGTVLYAVLIGPICHWTVPALAVKLPAPEEPATATEREPVVV
jgi:uncharacterized membrane protein YczE